MGCAAASPGPASRELPPEPPRETARSLELDRWQDGGLHCAAARCGDWYRLDVARPGELRVEVHAPVEPGADFDLRLEDEQGEMLWGFAPTGTSPRRIDRAVAAGAHYLLVSSLSTGDAPLDYELHARVVEIGTPRSEAPASAASRALAARAGSRAPAGPAAESAGPVERSGAEIWIGAEILRVEGREGRPEFLVIDVGSRDRMRVGLRAELVDEGRTIGVLELAEVFDDESRARLTVGPRSPVETSARVRIRVRLEPPTGD